MGEPILLKKEESLVNEAGIRKASNSIRLSEGEIAVDGDTVIDIPSKVEGVLRFSVWAWLVVWEDGMTTIMLDPSILKLKK